MALHETFQTILDGTVRANAVAAVLAAEYTNGSKARGPVLTINQIVNGRRHCVEIIDVSGKIQARREATARGAKCWNF